MERRGERWRRMVGRFDCAGGRRYDGERWTVQKMGATAEDAVGMKRARSRRAQLFRLEKERGAHLMKESTLLTHLADQGMMMGVGGQS